jgi:hypothetical protein
LSDGRRFFFLRFFLREVLEDDELAIRISPALEGASSGALRVSSGAAPALGAGTSRQSAQTSKQGRGGPFRTLRFPLTNTPFGSRSTHPTQRVRALALRPRVSTGLPVRGAAASRDRAGTSADTSALASVPLRVAFTPAYTS